MGKLFRELEIQPIKLESKFGTKEMSTFYKEMNNLLYFFSTLYISPKSKDYLMKEVEKTGKAINKLTVPSSKIKYRDELLSKLRTIYQRLKYFTPEDMDNITFDKQSKFVLAKFLKQKRENGLSIEDKMKWLENNLIYTNIYGFSPSVASIQDEIIKKFKI